MEMASYFLLLFLWGWKIGSFERRACVRVEERKSAKGEREKNRGPLRSRVYVQQERKKNKESSTFFASIAHTHACCPVTMSFRKIETQYNATGGGSGNGQAGCSTMRHSRRQIFMRPKKKRNGRKASNNTTASACQKPNRERERENGGVNWREIESK